MYGCVVDKSFNHNYIIKNSSNQKAVITYYARGNSYGNFTIEKLSILNIERRSNMGGYSQSYTGMFEYLTGSDSIKVTFSDGKIKTDKKSEVDTNPRNMYNNILYTKQSCGKDCEDFIYTVNEQDYAEAK